MLHWGGVGDILFEEVYPKKVKNRKKTVKSLGQKRASFLPNTDQQIRVLQADIRVKQEEETGESESKFSMGHPGCILNLFYPNITLTLLQSNHC